MGDSKIKSFSRKEVILVPVPKMEFRIQDIYEFKRVFISSSNLY